MYYILIFLYFYAHLKHIWKELEKKDERKHEKKTWIADGFVKLFWFFVSYLENLHAA